nr:hypothetical protein [Tanacetum cinerariifolium]
MGDEHLDTISKTESDEFIKSSAENLVPSLSESEDLSDSECDVPACDDFTTIFNFLFDVDDNFSSSDNESFFDEDISKEIYSNPLFDEEIISIKIDPHHFNAESDLIESLLNHDSSITSSSSKIDSLLNEFAGDLTLIKSIPPGIDETDYDHEEEIFIPTEPIDSLSMGDEHLNTIPAMESDEFIKSCIENLVPNPSESKGENGCDVPAGFTTFSNVLFDDDYDSDSSDDRSLSDETDSLFNEFAGELTLLKSFSSGIYETDCHPEKEIHLTKRLLYDNSSPRPPKEIVSDNSNADIESFSPSPILNLDSDPLMEEIDLSFNPDDPMPPSIEEDNDDSERDIPILEELLDSYSLSLPNTESYHFDIPSPYRPLAKPPDEFNSKNSDAAIESFTLSPIPVEDSNSLMEEIDLSFTPDDPMPPGIEEDDYVTERDMLIFEELLSNDSLSLLENESFHFDIPSSSRPPAKPPDDDLEIWLSR